MQVLTHHNECVKDVTFSVMHCLLTASYDGTAIEYDFNPLLKDIPARIEFLFVLNRIVARNESEAHAHSMIRFFDESLLDFVLYANARPRLRARIVSFL